jgi:hypothetical protein
MNNEQVFIVNELEKGVKKYVVDKDRKKEILAVTKATTDTIETFNKHRKNQEKEFRSMNRNRNSTRADFEKYFGDRAKERLDIQMIMIENRLRMYEKIKQDEWNSIIETEKEARQKMIDKLNKKIAKGNIISPFTGMEKAIDQSIANEITKAELIETLDSFKSTHQSWVEKANDFSALDNEVLAKRDATREELVKEIMELNRFRMEMFSDIVDFRLSVSEKTNKEEWEALIEELDKIMGKHRILE